MDLQIRQCSMCGKNKPAVQFSRIDPNTCSACASKALKQARISDDSWVEQNRQAGIELWEHQPQEPMNAFLAFVVIRDAYPNKMRLVDIAAVTGHSQQAIGYWSRRWKWQMRLDAWVSELDRQRLEQELATRRDMNDRQITVAQKLHAKALDRVENIDVDELTPREVAQWLEISAKLERTAVQSNEDVTKAEMQRRTSQMKEQGSAPEENKVADILKILGNAGALQTGAFEVTTTKEVTTVKHAGQSHTVVDEQSDLEGDNIIQADFSVNEEFAEKEE